MEKMKNVVGVIPAAGSGTRVSPLPLSKELFPVSIDEDGESGSGSVSAGSYIRVASSFLADQMIAAGTGKIYWVIRRGKWDIPDYFTNIEAGDNKFAWIVVNETKSVSETIDKAYSFLENQIVLTGFPDIVISPDNALSVLYDNLIKTDGDVLLGLFPASDSASVDMVDFDKDSEKEINIVHSIQVKPSSTNLRYTWLLAVWRPAFTNFLHHSVNGHLRVKDVDKVNEKNNELHLGFVLNEAIKEGFKVYGRLFRNGSYRDYGNKEGIKSVISRFE
jgi:glucose-1-phosphate thymidylyltransferase